MARRRRVSRTKVFVLRAGYRRTQRSCDQSTYLSIAVAGFPKKRVVHIRKRGQSLL